MINLLANAMLRLRPESRLVAMVRAGDAPAFPEIVRRYRPALVSYASGFVSPDRAVEVVEEGFWRAHVIVTSTRGELALEPWLFTVVHNGALNASRGVQPALPLHSPDTPMGVQQVPAATGEIESLVETLRSLPPAQRERLAAAEFGRLERPPSRRRVAALAAIASLPAFAGQAWARTGDRLDTVRHQLADRFARARTDRPVRRPVTPAPDARRRASAAFALAAIAAAVALVISNEAGVGDSAATAEQPGTAAAVAADAQKRPEAAGPTTVQAGDASRQRSADRDPATDGASSDENVGRNGFAVRGSRDAGTSEPAGTAGSTGTGVDSGGGGEDASGGGSGGGGSGSSGGGSGGGGSAAGGSGGDGSGGGSVPGEASGGGSGGESAAPPAGAGGSGGDSAAPPAGDAGSPGGGSAGGEASGGGSAGGGPPPNQGPSPAAPPPPPPPSDDDDDDDGHGHWDDDDDDDRDWDDDDDDDDDDEDDDDD